MPSERESTASFPSPACAVNLAAEIDAADAVGWLPASEPTNQYDYAKTIKLPDGPLAGTFLNPLAERAIELWLRMLSENKYHWYLQVAPSQRAKTTVGIMIPLLHGLTELRTNVGYVMPSLDKLGQKWEGSLKPMIENCGYGAYLPDKGPGSKGGRPAVLTIRDPLTKRRISRAYFMALGKGGSETATASNPCSRLLIDEADDAESAGQIKLAMKRTASYGAAGGGIIVSTVNGRVGRDFHPILEMLSEGTNSRLAHLCPHCSAHVVPELENFDPIKAAITCPACAVVWSESDRHLARNAAVYKHCNPDASVFSVLYTQLDYFWEYPDRTGKIQLALPTLGAEHRTAQAAKDRGDISQWNTYLRKSWCRKESEEEMTVPRLEEMSLATRSAKSLHSRGIIPADAGVISIGCDFGKRDAWWLAIDIKPDYSWRILDWSVKTTASRVEPSIDDQKDMLDRMRLRMLRLGRCSISGIDAGFSPDIVVPWARRHDMKIVRGDYRDDGRREQPSGKKENDNNKNLPSWAEDRKQDDGSHWIFLDGSAIKKILFSGLLIEQGKAGSGAIPTGQAADDWLIRHLTSERWNSTDNCWDKIRKDNHLLDCLVYAYALGVIELMRPKYDDSPTSDPDARDGGWDSNLDSL